MKHQIVSRYPFVVLYSMGNCSKAVDYGPHQLMEHEIRNQYQYIKFNEEMPSKPLLSMSEVCIVNDKLYLAFHGDKFQVIVLPKVNI